LPDGWWGFGHCTARTTAGQGRGVAPGIATLVVGIWRDFAALDGWRGGRFGRLQSHYSRSRDDLAGVHAPPAEQPASYRTSFLVELAPDHTHRVCDAAPRRGPGDFRADGPAHPRLAACRLV